MWDVTSGRTTEAVCIVVWHTWREPLILQKQESSHPVEKSSPVPLEKPNPVTNITKPWWVIYKEGWTLSLQSEEPWGLQTHLVMSPIFPCNSTRKFFLRWLTTHPNQLPKLWTPSPALAPRAMKLGNERGNHIPPQFTTCMTGRLLGQPRGATVLPASSGHSQNNYWETNIFQILMTNSDFYNMPLWLITKSAWK